jgi:hypothetical protein
MKPNTITLIIIVLVCAVGGYWYFSGQSDTDAPLTAVAPSGDNPAQSQFQALVSQLQPISFSTDIFTDPRFNALVDLTTPITPESVGRIDPFAPIQGVAGL